MTEIFRRKKIKNLDDEDEDQPVRRPGTRGVIPTTTPAIIPPKQRASNYISLVRKSFDPIGPVKPPPRPPETINLKMTDKEGLERAYNTKEGVFVFGDRMYLAGSKSLNDWKDDVMRIPAWGDSRKIQRYQDAKKALQDHPEVTHISGHSLGSSVALQLQKDFKHIQDTRVYGSPVLDIKPSEEKVDRYRSYGDPVSMFDFNANSSLPTSLNPHEYGNLSEGFSTSKTVPIESTNPDGSKSLIA